MVPSPNAGTSDDLHGVATVSSSDVWAVGSYYNGTAGQTLAEHWDGTVWNIVPSPNSGSNGSALSEVAVVSANDVWAVGSYFNGNFDNQTLVEHWNGSAWSVVPSPNVGIDDLYGVAAVSSSDVWAVGYYYTNTGPIQTLVEHWNGSAWSVVPSPNVGTLDNGLQGVAAISGSDV